MLRQSPPVVHFYKTIENTSRKVLKTASFKTTQQVGSSPEVICCIFLCHFTSVTHQLSNGDAHIKWVQLGLKKTTKRNSNRFLTVHNFTIEPNTFEWSEPILHVLRSGSPQKMLYLHSHKLVMKFLCSLQMLCTQTHKEVSADRGAL